MNSIYCDSKSVLIQQKNCCDKNTDKMKTKSWWRDKTSFFPFNLLVVQFSTALTGALSLSQQTQPGNRFHVFRLHIANVLNYDTTGFPCVLCPGQTREKKTVNTQHLKNITGPSPLRQETDWIKVRPTRLKVIFIVWLWQPHSNSAPWLPKERWLWTAPQTEAVCKEKSLH